MEKKDKIDAVLDKISPFVWGAYGIVMIIFMVKVIVWLCR